ncbi:MAG TPA: hypothetical protein VMZ06_01090 [Candidatus Bathyarchaeia archaeon]|nr:hypothetical protein [Candidatus Bathyarchaeia archaeon]
MRERFTDSVKAACYVALGLSKDFPNAILEVTYQSQAHVRRETCSAETAERLLTPMCRRFHRSDVRYQPDNPDGVVVRIECHCIEGIKGTCCNRGADRPKVTVRVYGPATPAADGLAASPF